MKNVAKIMLLVAFIGSFQGCSTDQGVDTDSAYESLMNTIDGTPFRNRKYEYARVQVDERASLKIPKGLNGSEIKPVFELPSGQNNYPSSQVNEAEANMLPPNFTSSYDINKILSDQISKLSISVVYGKDSDLKLVFREPLSITIELLDDYFAAHKDQYEILAEEDKMLSRHIIRVQNLQTKLIYVVKSRDIDDLSSLVTVPAVFNSDGDSMASNYVDEGVKLLTRIRKELNGITIKQQSAEMIAQLANPVQSSKSKSSFGGLASSASSFSFGSYNQKVHQESARNYDDTSSYIDAVDKANDTPYQGQATAKELN